MSIAPVNLVFNVVKEFNSVAAAISGINADPTLPSDVKLAVVGSLNRMSNPGPHAAIYVNVSGIDSTLGAAYSVITKIISTHAD